MRLEDIIPFLVMIAYIALVLFKQRKKSGDDAKSRVEKKPARDRARQERTQDNPWDRIQGKIQDNILGKPRQEKPSASFGDSSKDSYKDRGRERPLEASREGGMFSKLGERLGVFFSELEQQFRMEAEKARMKGQMAGQVGQARSRESDKSQAAEQGLFADFDQVDFDVPAFTPEDDDDSRPVKAPKTLTTARAKKQAPGPLLIKEPLRSPRPGVNLTLSPDEIRTAVVWSEILGPPIALRTGKRPWEN